MAEKHHKLIIMIGNIGSGKSTIARQYSSQGYIVVGRDELRSMLNGGKYQFRSQLEPVIQAGVVAMLESLMDQGHNIVLDQTSMSQNNRRMFIQLGKDYGYDVFAFVMPVIEMSECIRRRMQDASRNMDLDAWARVWTRFDESYEEPTVQEGFDDIIEGASDDSNRTVW